MQVSRLKIENFQGAKSAEIDFDGHTLLVGQNNVGKSTVCEALELALSADREYRSSINEWDFYNAQYLSVDLEPIPIRIEVLLTNVTPTIEKTCMHHLERWHVPERRILGEGEIAEVDGEERVWCLRLLTIARYDPDEDEFEVHTHFAKSYDPDDETESRVSKAIRRNIGFLYLRALRTGSRALSLERGSLLDVILRLKTLHAGLWEQVRGRLNSLDPPISDATPLLLPVLKDIEKRLGEYISISPKGDATALHVSNLTRDHLRSTLSFFLSITQDQCPVPFQNAGTGTLNTLVLALLTFIGELKQENVIFAMEEPEIALPPHTQRRIASYLLSEKTTQCFVTSHSPYVIECFEAERVTILRRSQDGVVYAKPIKLGPEMKAKTYRRHVRRALAEAMLARAVVIAEGVTEHLVLQSAAEKLEAEDEARYPLDLSGVTMFSVDGDGSAAEFCRFFVSLDLPVYALLDKKNRPPKERVALDTAGFTLLEETAYVGMEELLADEAPFDVQWAYLELLRERPGSAGVSIPEVRPPEEELVALTIGALKAGKGAGRSAELVSMCSIDQLPPTITKFLDAIYEAFPRQATFEDQGTAVLAMNDVDSV